MTRILVPTGPHCADGRFDAVRELALRSCAAAPATTVFRQLESTPLGLTEAEASQRLCRPVDDATSAPAARLRDAVLSPFVVLLAGLGTVFGALGDARGWVTVGVMVAVSIGLRWWLQVRSDRAMHVLRSSVSVTATVRRRAAPDRASVEREVPVDDVVPGDVVVLAAGDVVPADLRLMGAQNLRVDQAVLSGEVSAARKHAVEERPPAHRPARCFVDVVDLPSVCFAGTSVVSGSGTGVVLAAGGATYFDAVAGEAAGERPRSSVEQGVRAVGWTLVRFMLVLAPIVLVVNGTVTGDWAQAALFAVAVAVGLTPEMLPVIVTATLARGAVRLARHDVVVKRLDAVGDLAGIDVLCVDKTGTLTANRAVYIHGIDLEGRLDEAAVEHAFLVSHFQEGPPDRLDDAVAEHVGDGANLLAEALYTKVDEIAFDHERRRSTVVLRDGGGDHLLVSKGDPDEVLALCTTARLRGEELELDPALRKAAADCVAAHQANGMRILAVAVKDGPAVRPTWGYGPDDETGLVLLGFVGFVDPVKETAPGAIEALAAHGVAVKMLTGDSPRVAAQLCEQAGIPIGRIVTGQQVEAASDAALRRMVAGATVLAKVNPRHKARIVAALREDGHGVGFLGDGVNDAAALRAADVGICVDTASPAARAAADLVLLEADLAVLAAGVVEGRQVIGNTMKYMKITAASNLGNVFSVLAASALLPFLPMLPIQLMVANLIYDAAQLALPWDRVERGYLRRPRRWDARGLTRLMLVFGPLSSVFDLATFASLWVLLGVDSPAEQATFQAAWFTESLVSQLLVVLVLRTRHLGRPAPAVLAATGAAVLACLAVPLSVLAGPLHLTPLPSAFVPWLLTIVTAYLLAALVAKTVFARRSDGWL